MKLYLDKSEIWNCNITVSNASLKNASARLLVETNDKTYLFKGTIQGNKISVPLPKMEGILIDGSKGKITLECIVEDTYFSPYSDDYEVDAYHKVEASKIETNAVSAQKPTVVVDVPKAPEPPKVEVQKDSITVLAETISELL